VIGQCLSNKNESATVAKKPKFCELNKATCLNKIGFSLIYSNKRAKIPANALQCLDSSNAPLPSTTRMKYDLDSRYHDRVFGWGLGGLGWIQPSFWSRSQPIQCLVALLFLGTEPTHFSVWLKNWRQSGSVQCLVEGIQCLVGANPAGAAPSARF